MLSLQTDSIQYFVGSARRPGSIDCYQDWKSFVNLQDKYGHITPFISDPDLHLLVKLQSYLMTKYASIPRWLINLVIIQLLWCLPQIAMSTWPLSYLHQMSPGMQTKVWFGHNPTSCPRVSLPQNQCIDLIFKLMVIQVGHTHKLILDLYLSHSLVIAEAMGIMFLSQVKMNILVPKLMFGFSREHK